MMLLSVWFAVLCQMVHVSCCLLLPLYELEVYQCWLALLAEHCERKLVKDCELNERPRSHLPNLNDVAVCSRTI